MSSVVDEGKVQSIKLQHSLKERLSCSYSVDEGLVRSTIKNSKKKQNKKLPLFKVVQSSKLCLTASGKVPGEKKPV